MQPILLFNSLTHSKILDWSKLKALANDKLNFAKMMIIFDREKIIVEKTRKCCLPAFSPFFRMFSKSYFLRVVNSLDCMVKG